jgi:ATP phosphoribosyltransferase
VDGLTLALPRGRLWGEVRDRLTAAGLPGLEGLDEERRLLVEADGGWRYLLARPADVLTYVREGVADAGVTGKDVLLEGPEGVYELLDLGVGACRLAVAAPRGVDWPALLADRGDGLRVATKYPRATRAHFALRGVCPRVIKLAGAVELAPQVDLADAIVDLVATGRTLEANGLCVVDVVAPVTSRVIANQASYRWRASDLAELGRRLSS